MPKINPEFDPNELNINIPEPSSPQKGINPISNPGATINSPSNPNNSIQNVKSQNRRNLLWLLGGTILTGVGALALPEYMKWASTRLEAKPASPLPSPVAKSTSAAIQIGSGYEPSPAARQELPTQPPTPRPTSPPTPNRSLGAAKPVDRVERRVPTSTPRIVPFDLPNESQIRQRGTTTYELARNIMQADFIGHDVINEIFGTDIHPNTMPQIPFDTQELETARSLNQFLIFRPKNTRGDDLMNEAALNTALGKYNKQSKIISNGGYFLDNLSSVSPQQRWSLVEKTLLPDAVTPSYDHSGRALVQSLLGQIESASVYLLGQVFQNQKIPELVYNALHEYVQKKPFILKHGDNDSAWKQIYNLRMVHLLRHKTIDLLYDLTVYEIYRNERLLQGQSAFVAKNSQFNPEGGFTFVGRAALPNPEVIQYMGTVGHTRGIHILEPVGTVLMR